MDSLMDLNYVQRELYSIALDKHNLAIHSQMKLKGHRSNSCKNIINTHFHFSSSETHPISGTFSLLPVDEFSILSFAYILALMSLPDSTLSIAGSSSHPLIKGRPRNRGRTLGPRGDPNTQPIPEPTSSS